MKVIINFGEKKVVVPCGIDGDISIRELINVATAKYCKLSYNNGSVLNSDQVQLRLNNGAVVDPDDRVCDVVDDREELFATIECQQLNYPSYTTINSNGDLSSSITSSNLSSSLSEHDRLMVQNSNNRHEVIVTDADLRTRSLRVKDDTNSNSQQSISQQSSFNNKIKHRPMYSPPTHDATKFQSSDDTIGMYNIYIDEITGDKIFSIILPKENSPLGIHVIPYNDDEQQVNGLILQNIEADGRIKRQGILQLNDRIIEINRINIERCSFDKAQLIFRTALLEPELELKIIRSIKKSSIPKSTLFHSNTNKTRSTLSEINQNNDLLFVDNDSNMNSLNTRRLGKIIKIPLVKGNDGLGFKLASRDNPTGVANPIYVKTIFPKGAAIEDGRLQRGDRLLTVNSIDVTQMSLQETVGLLRETRIGDTVEICISRQRDGSLPQDLMNDEIHITDIKNEIKPHIMTFDIPLNDTSSAGLGITLKGKTSIIDGQSIDLGIFVKSILTGGAASRDNRLRPNDQILVINDSSLINISNLEAAAILHEAVRREIHPGHIKVTISRLPMTADDQHMNSTRYVKEIDLLPPSLSSSLIPVNNDENELDLTTFVPPPPLIRKPPTQQSSRHSSRLESTRLVDSSSPRSASATVRSKINQSPSRAKQIFIQPQNEQITPDDVDNGGINPFERETPFRQSISEKRRLTHQPNKQAIQWKQRSFHESRTSTERRNDGLGFKLASRDNPTDIANPIYVKTIFPKGAAIEDGRLQRCDRLLTVNSIDVTQMSLQDTVDLLRKTHIGDTVELCISRQRDGSLSQDLINDEIKPQIMTFDIPLNNTSSVDLGIILEGKISIVDGQSIDLGIFVKSILTGGAAFRDNRLRPNDQILVINEESLINISNLEAADILHETVRREIHLGHIKITILRLSMITDDQHMNSTRYVKEIDLLPPSPSSLMPINNDENELDFTTFVPLPLVRKPPIQQSSRHSSRLKSTLATVHSTINQSPSRIKQIFIQSRNEHQASDDVDNGDIIPFVRETPFRQSISEKRRVTHQSNKLIIQWKQRSLHDGRTLTERKQPIRTLPDSSSSKNNNNNNRSLPDLIHLSSFESIYTIPEGHDSPNVVLLNNEERKRQAKLRRRACNDSFRQAVDESYCHNQNVNESVTPDDVDNGGINPFERETPFRQSISEKRRLTHQPNKQAIQWKQRSFHESRTSTERKQPMRTLPDSSSSKKNNNNNRSSPGLIRSSSFESIHTTTEGHDPSNVILINDEERKRQAKLRSRACNDSFRQAVDKSYCHNHNVNEDEIMNDDKLNKSEKHRFRFSNLFSSKSKRKEHQEETTNKLMGIQHHTLSHDNRPMFYPPPPPPFISRQDSTSSSSSTANKPVKTQNTAVFSYPSTSNEQPQQQQQQQQQGYQPYRFDSNQASLHGQQKIDNLVPTRYESQIIHDYQSKNISGKSSLSINNQKTSYPSIPKQFLQTNINGSQSLKQRQSSSHPSIIPVSSNHSLYPSTFTVQPSHFTSYSHNIDTPINTSHHHQQQQQRRIGYTAAPVYPTSRGYFHVESPANV
ncbi:unnamed protein product [Rotaria sordida]|uniref:PDZ domain-containing protein n=1 Tax=Rotaria sordida TaxID=392033 RepID=A0A813X5N8_9BILA|nr:unnamed protein product [Rotaria sordida]